jgi:septum site-determining protein MinD
MVTDALSSEQTTVSKRVIVVTSGKGGVGKTTVTANLGVSIARLGYKTLLIDADIGLRNLDLLLGMENRLTYTAMDVLENGCRLDQALVYDKRWPNLVFLAISKNRQRYHITEQNMINIVRAFIRLNYDFILIDCPAGIDVGFMNAIAPATESIIVTTPELPALRDADYVLGLLESNGIYNNKVLVNRVRIDMIEQYDMLSVYDAQETLGIPLLGAIPENKTIISATNCGEPLVLQNQFNVAGLCFEMTSRKLVGQNETVLDLNMPYKNKFEQFFNKH